MAVYLSNAFSLSMLPAATWTHLAVREFEVVSDIPGLWLDDAISVVGHQETADLFTVLLGFEVKCNRQSIRLEYGDKLIVGQYLGPRLPEGVTSLPEGASIRWYLVAFASKKGSFSPDI